MAAADVLFSCGDRLVSEYGRGATLPSWSSAWDVEDTRLRLRLIARAWISLRCPDASPRELVRLRRLFFCVQDSFLRSSALDHRCCPAVAAKSVPLSRRCGTLTAQISNDVYRIRLRLWYLRGAVSLAPGLKMPGGLASNRNAAKPKPSGTTSPTSTTLMPSHDHAPSSR